MPFLFIIAWLFSSWMIAAWGFMLFVGNLHNWWIFIPTMGFDTSMGVVLPLLFILGPILFSRYSSSNS